MLAASAVRGADEGLFADFHTSLGDFTCRLEFAKTPRTVANFVGLATGRRAWMDPATGAVRRAPFYDGLTFHRVIAGFMIQGGSPNGLGTDGPGYAFRDEFDPELRHDGPGVLSMANSGPNSNGSQFFITVAATPWLDGRHTVFGRVVAGMEVVTAISQVATDAQDRPVEPVVIRGIDIRAVGPAAEAFDPDAHGLPVVEPAALSIRRVPGGIELVYPESLFAQHYLRSGDLDGAWTVEPLGLDLAAPAQTSRRLAAEGRARFFALTRVRYGESTLAPRSLAGRTLTLVLPGTAGELEVRFDDSGGGSYTLGGDTGTVGGYVWLQEPWRGRLWPIEFSGLVPMTLRLDFSSETAGTYSGTAHAATPFAIEGAFRLEGP
ncbi:MAG: peptidylprolyl isomerase [Verrucomicrobia bacterium]|nr:MAG: peptidylprolyl isomerase [Verrucomicrobiota bacterium]